MGGSESSGGDQGYGRRRGRRSPVHLRRARRRHARAGLGARRRETVTVPYPEGDLWLPPSVTPPATSSASGNAAHADSAPIATTQVSVCGGRATETSARLPGAASRSAETPRRRSQRERLEKPRPANPKVHRSRQRGDSQMPIRASSACAVRGPARVGTAPFPDFATRRLVGDLLPEDIRARYDRLPVGSEERVSVALDASPTRS
jgi:hypothetical protein